MANTNTTNIPTGKKRGPKIRNFWERKFATRVAFSGAVLKKFGLVQNDNTEERAAAVSALQDFLHQKLSEL